MPQALSDHALQLVDKNNGKGKPEFRIPALIFGSVFVPVGVLYVPPSPLRWIIAHHPPNSWYGWSVQARIHWIMPIIGTGIFGFGMMTTLYAPSHRLLFRDRAH